MTSRGLAKLSALLAVTAVPGCNEASSPGPAGSLEFTAQLSPSTIRVGETATFTLRLRNTGRDVITLHFPSSCQIVPYVATVAGQDVFPGDGGWVCGQALTQLRLAPGATAMRVIDVHGGAAQPATHAMPQLAPGSYRLWGELGVPPRVQGRTLTAELTVVE